MHVVNIFLKAGHILFRLFKRSITDSQCQSLSLITKRNIKHLFLKVDPTCHQMELHESKYGNDLTIDYLCMTELMDFGIIVDDTKGAKSY